MAFHPMFLPGPDEVLIALADQDFPSCTCCHFCFKVFVHPVVFLNVKIGSHQMTSTKAGSFSQLHGAVKIAWIFVLVLAWKHCFSAENQKKSVWYTRDAHNRCFRLKIQPQGLTLIQQKFTISCVMSRLYTSFEYWIHQQEESPFWACSINSWQCCTISPACACKRSCVSSGATPSLLRFGTASPNTDRGKGWWPLPVPWVWSGWGCQVLRCHQETMNGQVSGLL